MKKIKNLLLITMLMTLISSIQAKETFAQESRRNVRLGVEFVFGRKSMDCGGFGICKFSIDFEVTNSTEARLIPSEQVLQIMLPYEFVDKYNEQLGGEMFEMGGRLDFKRGSFKGI